MKSLFAFLKKEGMESVRTGKMLFLLILFVLFGIMNPAIAKLTPWMLELLSDSLAETGMLVTEVQVDALTSWTQFFKNIPLALIVFLLMYHGIFSREYQSGTLVLLLTKGLPRRNVLLAKTSLLLALWSAGYWLCFAVTYGYNQFFWDNQTVPHLLAAVGFWWLFGVWTLCLMVLFSVVFDNPSGILLGTGGCVLASYLIGLFPTTSAYMPTQLMNCAPLLMAAETPDFYLKAGIVALLLCILSLGAALLLFRKKLL